MQYKVIKKTVGKGGSTIVSNFQTNNEILDTSLYKDSGIFIIEKGNPSITLMEFNGKIIKNWIGKDDDSRIQNGSVKMARLKNPCSICHNNKTAYIIEDQGKIVRTLDLSNRYFQSYTGDKYIEDLENHINNKKSSYYIKSSVTKTGVAFVSGATSKIFYLSYGNLENVLGDGKSRFSVSNNYKLSSFNKPSGICVIGNKTYVSDTNNHCIRLIDNKGIYIVCGNPSGYRETDESVKFPAKLIIKRNVMFILDDNKIKTTNLTSNNISTIYKSGIIDSFEADEQRNIYIFERQ